MKRALSLALLVSMLFIAPLPSHANSSLDHKIFRQIKYVASYSFGSTSMSAMNEAIYKWNSVIGWSSMSRDPSLRHYDNIINSFDNKNYIYKVIGADYLAINYSRAENGILVESDINFNTLIKWANSAQPGAYDFESVFLHETGHTAGLNHSPFQTAVMYKYLPSNTTKRYLTQDDINQINALY